MKKLLLIIALICSPVFAFQPNDIIGGDIKQVGECPPLNCMLIEKDGVQYIVSFVAREGYAEIMEVFIVEDKKLRKVWSITWKET